MKAVILAAGEGKRMLPLTRTIPKPLLRVGNRTIIDYIFEALPEPVDEAVVVVGYLKKKIQEHIGYQFQGRRIRYVNQDVLNGTATALHCAKDLFAPSERFMTIYGDELPIKEEMDRCVVEEFSWLCYPTDTPQQSGIAELDQSGRILSVIEKPINPLSNIAAAGVMVMNSDIFFYPLAQHDNGEYYLTALMNDFVKDHAVMAVVGEKRPGFTSPDEIEKIEMWQDSRMNSEL